MNRETRRKLAKEGSKMSDPLVPTTTITLDRERTLRMDLNALADFERVSGKSVMRGGFAIETMAIADIRDLLWACLVQEDESLSARQVGAMLHPGNLSKISDALAALFGNVMPEQEGDSATPLPETAAEASTG